MTTCHNCQTEFTPKRSTARFCGPTCRVAGHRGTPSERGTDHRSGATGAVLALHPTQVAPKPTRAPKAPVVTLRQPISRPYKLPSGPRHRTGDGGTSRPVRGLGCRPACDHLPYAAAGRRAGSTSGRCGAGDQDRHAARRGRLRPPEINGRRCGKVGSSTSSSGRPIFVAYRASPMARAA